LWIACIDLKAAFDSAVIDWDTTSNSRLREGILGYTDTESAV